MLISVGIPTVDRLSYLKEAVASALAATHTDLEVIVSDDGNSVELSHWVQELSAKEPRLRYQRTQGHVGLAGNWNAIAATASGVYTVIIGDDDRLLPSFVSDLLARSCDADVVFSNHFLIDAKGSRLFEETRSATEHYRRDGLVGGLVDDPIKVVWCNSVPMSASLIRTSWLKRLAFREDLNTPELEFFARLAHAGGTFAFVPSFLAEYRVHPHSATAGGLTLDRLADYLSRIPVPPSVLQKKQQLLGALMMGAVSRSLAGSDSSTARELVRAELYPAWDAGGIRRLGQVVCALLPGSIGGPMYRLTGTIHRALLRSAGPYVESKVSK